MPKKIKPMWKTTLVIWSQEKPSRMALSTLIDSPLTHCSARYEDYIRNPSDDLDPPDENCLGESDYEGES
jgi:hypothetical protein